MQEANITFSKVYGDKNRASMFIFQTFLNIPKGIYNMTFKGFLLLLLFLVTFSCTNNTDKEVETSAINTSKIDAIRTHQFIARLHEGFNSTAHCGVIATAYAYKFKVIQTDLKDLKDKWIVIIQPCPELLGNGFFKTGEIYKILTDEKNMDYIISNSYEKENLHTFWSREISSVK